MPAYDIPILQMPMRLKPLGMDHWNIANLGIIAYGAGVSFDAAASLGIPEVFDAPASLGIPVPSIADPTAVLAAHLGQGSVFLQWNHPAPAEVKHFEIWGSAFDGGPYLKLQHGETPATHALIHNIPMSMSVYLQVRSIGLNGAISNFVQARQGKFQNPQVRCSVRAISGSTIPAGALFVSRDEATGRLIGFRAVQDVTVTC